MPVCAPPEWVIVKHPIVLLWLRESVKVNRILLTPRERQVAEHRAAGLLYKQIADLLKISLNTVKHYLGQIFRKLGITTSNQLTRLFYTVGFA